MRLGDDELVDLYRTMSRIRSFENAVRRAVLEGQIPGSSHLYLGEEAIAAGVCSVLGDEDRIVSTYRGHGHTIARGGDMRPMMAEVYGRATGLGGGKLGSLHLAYPELGMLGANAIVGAGSPIAVGAAYAQKRLGTGGVTVVFFGDGASDRGTQHEAMNMAALWKLPVVFCVENNGIAYFTPQEQHQSILDVSVRAGGYDMRGITEYGNDVEKVVASARDAVDWCRSGKGPVLLEYKTYRQDGHFVGDPCEYRDAAVTEEWVRERDPLKTARKALADRGVARDQLDDIDRKAEAEVADAVEFAKASPYPAADTLYQNVYCEG